jgi:hypothetical protein
MGTGYTYDTTLTVGTTVVSHATGRWVDGSGEFVITTGGQSVTYRAIPPKAWVRNPGGSWVEVQGSLPSGNPVDALAKPTGTTVVSDAADSLVLDATYPSSALGLAGTDPVTVRTTLAANGVVTATYTVTIASGSAASTTVLTPAMGLAPVATP